MPQLTELENMVLADSLTNADGAVSSPMCCSQPMKDDGGCGQGCCDDYRCAVCGETIRIEWPD